MASQSFCLEAVISSPFLPKGSHGLVHQERFCDILYAGPLSWGPLLRATESHLPHRSGHGVHIGHPHHLIPLQYSWHSWLPWWAPTLLLSLRDLGALCTSLLR